MCVVQIWVEEVPQSEEGSLYERVEDDAPLAAAEEEEAEAEDQVSC